MSKPSFTNKKINTLADIFVYFFLFELNDQEKFIGVGHKDWYYRLNLRGKDLGSLKLFVDATVKLNRLYFSGYFS